MIPEAKNWWEEHGRQYQEMCNIPIDVLYGVGSPNDAELGLIGSVAGKSVLEIGCGGAQCSVAFAKQGAAVTAIDIASSEISHARKLAADHHVSIDLHQQDMADLSPVDSGTQDLVFSANAFSYVDDLDRCFQEVYRVLKPGGIFVFAMGHPFQKVVDPESLTAAQSYFDTAPKVEGHETGCAFASVHRKVSDYFNLLVAAGFQVERMLEPDSRVRYASDPWFGLWGIGEKYLALIPGTLIIKSLKPL